MLTLISNEKTILLNRTENSSNKKKFLFKFLMLLIVLLLVLSTKIFAVSVPKLNAYANDYAGILSLETENYINNTNKSLEAQTGAQIVVVTVQNLGGSAIEEYATQLFRANEIGDKTKNNGILFLIAVEERELRIETGYGVEGFLPDGRAGRIRDQYIIPYLRQNQWDEGIKNGYNALLDAVTTEYDVTVGAESAIPAGYYQEYADANWDGIYGFIAMVITTFGIGAVIGKFVDKNKKMTYGKTTLTFMICAIIFTGISMNICRNMVLPEVPVGELQLFSKGMLGFFIHMISLIIGASFTSKKVRNGTGGRGGGGYHGGYHRGGFGGGYHGGGFGGFSGGGGSSGGGGVSGRF